MQVSRAVAGSAMLFPSDEASEGRGGASLPRLTQAVGAALAAAPVAALAQVELPPVTVSEDRHDGFRAASTGSAKDPEALRDTARSVSVIPQEVIRTTAATSLTEVLRTVPGITFGAGEGGNPIGDRPFIRGYDAQASTFLDGFRDVGAQSREMFNVESVQVNKGPAGAYDGRGGAGGTINIQSKTPRLERFAEGAIGVGNAEYVRATVDGNWRVGEHAAVRLNAMSHSSDIPGRDAARVSRWGVAPSVAIGLGTATRVTASWYHLQSDDQPDVGIPYNNAPHTTRKDGLPRVRPTGDGRPLDVPRETYYGLLDRDFQKQQNDTGMLRIEHDFSPALKLRNQTRLSRTEQDFIWTQPDSNLGNTYYNLLWRRANTRVGTVDTVANQTDLSGSFRTGAIGHKYVAGVEFSEEKANWDTYKVDTGDRRCGKGAGAASGYNCTTVFDPDPADPWAGAIQRNHRPTDVRTRTLSAYLFDSAEITPQWLLNAGLRLDRYDTTLTQAPNASGVRNQFSRQDTLVNYQLGAVYKPVTWGSVYASFGTSSTPAGSFLGQGAESNALAPDAAGNRGDQLAPEKSRAVELGTKWDVLGEKLALTAAVFRIDTDNARILEQDGTARMAGERRVDGVELGFAGNVTARWAVYGGYTHQKATLRRNGGKGAANGATDGKVFPNTPADSFSLWTTYEVLPGLILGGGANYVSKVWGNEANTKWVPSYWRFDAMAAYRLSKAASVQFNLQNLTDKAYYAQAHRNHYATMAPGRAATLTLTLRY